jgi:cell division protein FtsL
MRDQLLCSSSTIHLQTGSVLVNEPFLIVGVAFGKSLKGLADLLRGEHLSGSELSVLIVGFVSSIVLTTAGIVYFRRALRQLEADEALSAAEHASVQQHEAAASSCTTLQVDLASTGRHSDVDHVHDDESSAAYYICTYLRG